MTKKILLKWLEARKAEALAQVDAQETAAKAALLAEKLERTAMSLFRMSSLLRRRSIRFRPALTAWTFLTRSQK